jgi:hypothetical protein
VDHHNRLGDEGWGAPVAGKWKKYSIGSADLFVEPELPNGLNSGVFGLVADFEGLGVLPTYSSYCYLIALLTSRLLEDRGFAVELFDCSATIKGRGLVFQLGAGPAKRGQIPGHLACIVDDRVLVDFGLGAARKYSGRQGIAQGVVCRLPTHERDCVSVRVPGGYEITWRRSAMPPNREHELSVNGTVAGAMLRHWRENAGCAANVVALTASDIGRLIAGREHELGEQPPDVLSTR